jgi:predicted GNAT family N-acyltransferase
VGLHRRRILCKTRSRGASGSGPWHVRRGAVAPTVRLLPRLSPCSLSEVPRSGGSTGTGTIFRVTLRVKLADSPAEWAGAVAVRLAVFVDEQGVPQAAELDDHDRSAVHAVAVLTGDDADETRRMEAERGGAVARAAAQAGKYLPVSIAGARQSSGDLTTLAPVVGTARLVGAAGGRARFGRLAVLPGWRKRGIGSRLLRLLEEAALARGASRLVLHAQTHLEAFYAKHGYAAAEPRDEFMEDGIPHLRMTKPLSLEM